MPKEINAPRPLRAFAMAGAMVAGVMGASLSEGQTNADTRVAMAEIFLQERGLKRLTAQEEPADAAACTQQGAKLVRVWDNNAAGAVVRVNACVVART